MKIKIIILAVIAVFVSLFTTSTAQSQSLYGYTSDGFYLHTSLANVVGSETPELITRVTKGQPLSMTLEGDYWVFHPKYKLLDSEKYCFKIGEEYIPFVFVSEWEHPAKKYINMINTSDVVDNGMNGFDFKTAKSATK